MKTLMLLHQSPLERNPTGSKQNSGLTTLLSSYSNMYGTGSQYEITLV